MFIDRGIGCRLCGASADPFRPTIDQDPRPHAGSHPEARSFENVIERDPGAFDRQRNAFLSILIFPLVVIA